MNDFYLSTFLYMSLIGGGLFFAYIVGAIALKIVDLFGWKKLTMTHSEFWSLINADTSDARIRAMNIIANKRKITWKKFQINYYTKVVKIK